MLSILPLYQSERRFHFHFLFIQLKIRMMGKCGVFFPQPGRNIQYFDVWFLPLGILKSELETFIPKVIRN